MALGTMVVVVLAVIGSVTVLPAMLSLLGDRDRQGPDPAVPPRAPAPLRLARHRRRGHAPPGRRAGARVLPARRARRARDADAHRLPRRLGSARATTRSCRPSTTSSAPSAHHRRRRARRHAARSSAARRGAPASRSSAARPPRAAHGRGSVRVAVARDGRTARIDIPMPAATTAPSAPPSSACAPRSASGGDDRLGRELGRLHRPAAHHDADRRRARPARGDGAAARRVPLAGPGARRDGLNLLSIGRDLRPDHRGLPAPLGRGAARVHLQRRDRGLAAAVRLRDRLRPLDGLHDPRARARPRGAGGGPLRARGGGRGRRRDRRRGHERRARDGRGVPPLRRAAACSSSSSSGSGSPPRCCSTRRSCAASRCRR